VCLVTWCELGQFLQIWSQRKNRDHKNVPKQDEDAGNLQILLHLRSLFQLHGIAFAIIPFTMYLHTVNFFQIAAVKIEILNVIEFANY